MAGLDRLDGAVALVTGAAGGIGLAAARQLVAAGGRVVLADVDEEAVRASAEELGTQDAVAVRCDVTVPADNAAAVARAEEAFGGLDLAVLNAGVATGSGWLESLSVERYDLVRAVNTDGVAYGVVAALPALRRRGRGAVVATASLAGLTPAPDDPVYTLTKTAVVGFVRALGPALLPEGISVNAVCPGFVDTAMVGPFVEAFHAAGFPLLQPDEVAAVALRAATSGETGQAFYVQPGREPAPYAFRGVPGARTPAGGTAAVGPGAFAPEQQA